MLASISVKLPDMDTLIEYQTGIPTSTLKRGLQKKAHFVEKYVCS